MSGSGADTVDDGHGTGGDREPVDDAGGAAGDGRARRPGRRRGTAVLAGITAAWLATGLALVWLDWPGSAEPEDSPHAGGVWEEITPAPLSERFGTGTVWAGDRLVVWSGVAAEGGETYRYGEPLTDGAVWTPSGEWLPMAAPPGGLALAPGGFAQWDGGEVLFGPVTATSGHGGHGPGDESVGGLLAYDPVADSWRGIPLSEGKLTADAGVGEPPHTAVVAGGELIIGHSYAVTRDSGEPGVVAVDPADGTTRLLDPGPYAAQEAREDDQEAREDDPDAREGDPAAPGTVSLVAAPERVVAVSGDGSEIWVLAPGSGEWTRAAAPPRPGVGRSSAGVAAGGTVLFLDDGGSHAYDIAADRWRELAGPPSAGDDPADAGIGYRWTGDVALAPGRAYDPAADRWAEVPRLPLEEGDRLSGPYVGWTGDALVVFGGGRAPCPAEGTCDVPDAVPETLAGWVYVN
ncbi:MULTISPECIES: hypothetical protein [unclassified Streptomyces]|uniref:hypothetical protein n=1 Tax=unclassified Streptomyces TaxID=2593676 RepID=UPI000CD4F305|nr:MULTISPECIES: hypothetical protein [unclassified Streptomyces]